MRCTSKVLAKALSVSVFSLVIQSTWADSDYTARRAIKELKSEVTDLTDRLDFITEALKKDGKEVQFPKVQCKVGIFLDYFSKDAAFSSKMTLHEGKAPVATFVGISEFRSGAEQAAETRCSEANNARRKADPTALGTCRPVLEDIPGGTTSNCKYIQN